MISSRVVFASASIEGLEGLFISLADNLVIVIFHYLKNQFVSMVRKQYLDTRRDKYTVRGTGRRSW